MERSRVKAAARLARVVLLPALFSACADTSSPVFLQRLNAPGPQPEGLASDGENLYVADFQNGVIDVVHTGTGALVRSHDAPGPNPEGLAWDGTHLWSADWTTRRIYRHAVTESTLTVVHEFPSPDGTRPVGLAWDGTMLWLTTWYPPGLYRIDPSTGAPVRTRPLVAWDPLYPAPQYHPEDLAWDGASLWITDWYTGSIYKVHPESLVVLETIPAGGHRSVGLTFHQGSLWNGDTGTSSNPPALYKLDAQGGPLDAAEAPASSEAAPNAPLGSR